MALVKTIIFTLLVPGTVTVVLPYLLLTRGPQIFSFELGPFRFLAIAPIVLGVVTYLWCAGAFALIGKGTPAPIDPPKVLVVRGPYRWTRNPMYVAVLSLLSGEALFFGSGTLLVYAAAWLIIFSLFVRLYEEPTLQQKFGEPYQEYCASVPRWLFFK